MHVPQHITVAGSTDQEYTKHRLTNMADKYAYQMNVPERILVAGGDEIRGDRAPPSEVMLDRMAALYPTPELASPPGILTLDKGPCPEISGDSPHPKDSPPLQEMSSSIEENPLHELKLMKRQLGRLSTRLYQLEDDFERRKTKESLLWTYVFSITGLFLYLFFKKKFLAWSSGFYSVVPYLVRLKNSVPEICRRIVSEMDGEQISRGGSSLEVWRELWSVVELE
uniref:Mitochondrial fission factor n=1 Tax=Setaria digitata TaxID=48799 RepID=A0A915PEY6_9BILA